VILIISEILQSIIDILEMFLIIEYDFFDILKVMPNINAQQREKFRVLEKEKSINKECKEYKSRSSGFLRERLRMNKKDN
tara:strand:- start:9430 stop:9669 length:240 start_codon:yes stop_codon:yes gene_type:complete